MPTLHLDPEVAEFLRLLTLAWQRHPPIAEMPIVKAREVAEEVRIPLRLGGPEMASISEEVVALPQGGLRIRIYRPAGLSSGPAPTLLYLHGGGFVFFSIDTHDRLMREYAAAAGIVVIGIDYPLSPEHPYPVALDRIVGFVDWLSLHAFDRHIDPARLAIGGDSAGANLALATLLRLRDEGHSTRFRAHIANYPAYAPDVSDQAERLYGGTDAILNRADMAYFFKNYLQDGPPTPYAQPLLAEDLSGMPPTLFVVPEIDVLRPQSEVMADRLSRSGGDATVHLYPGTIHSFLESMSITQVGRRAIRETDTWLAARI